MIIIIINEFFFSVKLISTFPFIIFIFAFISIWTKTKLLKSRERVWWRSCTRICGSISDRNNFIESQPHSYSRSFSETYWERMLDGTLEQANIALIACIKEENLARGLVHKRTLFVRKEMKQQRWHSMLYAEEVCLCVRWCGSSVRKWWERVKRKAEKTH